MRFLGVTNDTQEDAKQFIKRTEIPWPCAIVSDETIEALRANYDDNTSAAAPTLLIIDPSGRIVWTDSQDRIRHNTDGWAERFRLALHEAVRHLQPVVEAAEQGPGV